MLLFIILTCFALGIVSGYFLRSRLRLINFSSKLTEICVGVLLFILGAMVGKDPSIMGNIATLGLTALVITVGAVLGSILAVYPVYLWFYKGQK